MHVINTACWVCCSICFSFTASSATALSDSNSPPEVIQRLVVNALKKPPGPVEKDVTDQTVSTANALAKSLLDAGPAHEEIAATYDTFTIEGPLTSIYSEGSAALYSGRVKLTANSLKDYLADPPGEGAGVGFGDGGCFSMFTDSKVQPNGHFIATFCLVQQHGLWKVHGVYLSNQPMNGSNKAFVIHQLSVFAKKS